MAVENLTATTRTASHKGAGPGLGALLMTISTVEVTAAASATSTYKMGRIPSKARLSELSKLYNDDLASTGAPTLDVGTLYYTDAGVATSNATGINNGFDAATAGSNALVAGIQNYGKRAWELMGLASDPDVNVDIIVSIQDAATNTGGTLTLALYYAVD